MTEEAKVQQQFKEETNKIPSQKQEVNPGKESEMYPRPIYDADWYRPSQRLKDKVAIITGGDSGIGRSIAILYAREECDSVIVYLKNHEDAEETKKCVEKYGRKCVPIAGDLGDPKFCKEVIEKTITEFKKLDILINHAGYQLTKESLEDISDEQLEYTFRTNVFSMFYLTKAALKHMEEGSTIINTTSVTSYKGKKELLDYSASKGAITSFTRSLAINLAPKKIRVNGVAPGPIWTPFIPSSFPKEKVEHFGSHSLLGRAGQPIECATSYVFLASLESSFMTGQILHPNGGSIINT